MSSKETELNADNISTDNNYGSDAQLTHNSKSLTQNDLSTTHDDIKLPVQTNTPTASDITVETATTTTASKPRRSRGSWRERDTTPTEDIVPLVLPAPEHILSTYPKLSLLPYSFKSESKPITVLALLHNALKREFLDLLAILIPYMGRNLTENDDEEYVFEFEVSDLKIWWNTLLCLCFFISENDEHIISLVLEPAVKTAVRRNEQNLANDLEKERRSAADRYNFAMEPIFRAADTALIKHCMVNNHTSYERLNTKIRALVNFMLDSMDATDKLVGRIDDICEVEIVSLENSVVDGLRPFTRGRKSTFMFLCCRWMAEEDYIRRWVYRFSGIRARFFYESWKRTYFEEHADFIEAIIELMS